MSIPGDARLVDADDGALVELHQVGVHFAGPPPVTAVRAVSLRVDRGELVTIQGRSGSGKSTLLAVLGLLLRPSTGRLEAFGRDAATMSDRDAATARATRIGFVFQAFHLLDERSVLDNVGLPMAYADVARRGRRRSDTHGRIDRAMVSLEQVGMADKAMGSTAPLSGGERQRVAIARALANGSSLILADEPTGSLDTENGRLVARILADIPGPDRSVVVVTHDPEMAAIGSRRLVMVDGELQQCS